MSTFFSNLILITVFIIAPNVPASRASQFEGNDAPATIAPKLSLTDQNGNPLKHEDPDQMKLSLTDKNVPQSQLIPCEIAFFLNFFEELPAEVACRIASNLSPILFARLSSTCTYLYLILHTQHHNLPFIIKPIPFGEQLFFEMEHRFSLTDYPLDDEAYVMELCHRLPYSVTSTTRSSDEIFPMLLSQSEFVRSIWFENASVVPALESNFFSTTEEGNPQTLRDRQRFFENKEKRAQALKTVTELRGLYKRITSSPDKDNPDPKDKRSFLEDTEERHQAIKMVHPFLLLGLISEELLEMIPTSSDLHHRSYLSDIQEMILALRCFGISTHQKELTLTPQIDFDLWRLHLVNAFWKTRLYTVCSSLGKSHAISVSFENDMRGLIYCWSKNYAKKITWPFVRYEFEQELICQAVFRIFKGWLLAQNLPQEIKDALCIVVSNDLDDQHQSLHHINILKRFSVYYLTAQELSESNHQNDFFVRKVGEMIWEEAWKLRDPVQSAGALSQLAAYFETADKLSIDDNINAEIRFLAAEVKWEARKTGFVTDSLAHLAGCYETAAHLFTDNYRKARANHLAADATFQQAESHIDPVQKANTFEKAASLYPDKKNKIKCYTAAGETFRCAAETKWREANLLEGNQRSAAAKESRSLWENALHLFKKADVRDHIIQDTMNRISLSSRLCLRENRH